MVACWSGQSWRDHAELDGKLMNRVFGHLAGTPEYERFIMEYRTLIQRPDYRRLHTDELFAEYMRLLESGRIRFLTQLEEWQESLAEKCSAQAHEGLAQSIPLKTVTFGHAEGSQRTESGRVMPAIRLQAQMPLSGSTPLAVGQKSVFKDCLFTKWISPAQPALLLPRLTWWSLIPLLPGNELCLWKKPRWATITAWSMGFGREPVRILNSQMQLRREWGHGINSKEIS